MNAVEICQRNADKAAANIAEAAEKNRKAMPNCAAIKAEFIALFGDGVKLSWAKECDCRPMVGNLNWWKRVRCLFDYTPDNYMVTADMMIFGGMK